MDTGRNSSTIISISSMCNVGGACKGATSTEQVVATINIFKDDDDDPTEQVVSISTDTFEEDVVKVEDDVEEEKEYIDPYMSLVSLKQRSYWRRRMIPRVDTNTKRRLPWRI